MRIEVNYTPTTDRLTLWGIISKEGQPDVHTYACANEAYPITDTTLIYDQDIDDVLDSAFHAITYWCDWINVDGADDEMKFLSEALTHGGVVTLAVDGREHQLTKEKMIRGFQMHTNKDIEDFDAYDADAIVQRAIFGELVYA